MFIFTTKIHLRKLTVGLALAAALCASAAVAAVGARQALASAAVSPKGIKTEEDRVEYLAQWGWQVSPQALSVEELQLPETFGEEYAKYLSLQTQAGFDLTRSAGKRVKRYTYQVLNYPNGDTDVVAHLLLFRSTVIGGEIMGDGFLHSLEMPE